MLVLGLVLIFDFRQKIGGLLPLVVIIGVLGNIFSDLGTVRVLHAVVPVVLLAVHVVLQLGVIFSVVLVTFEVEGDLALTVELLLVVDDRTWKLRTDVLHQEVVHGSLLVVLSLIVVNLVVRQFELVVPVHNVQSQL